MPDFLHNIFAEMVYSTKLTKTAICVSPWAFTDTPTPKLVCNFTRTRMKEANPDRWPLNVEGFATWTNEVNPKPTEPAQAQPGDLLVMPNNINCFTKSDNGDEMTFTLSGWVNNVAGTKYYSLHPIFAQAEADEMQYELNIAARKYADEHSVPLSTVARSNAFWTTFGQDMCNFHTDRACVAGVLKKVWIKREDYDSLARSNMSTFVPSSDYFDPLEAGPEQLRVDQKWIESEETFPGTVKLQFTPALSIGPPAQ